MSKTKNPFTGLGIALVTPFDAEGNIDFATLADIIEFQIAGGIDFFCILGTTAETPTLTKKERKDVFDFAVKQINKRVPVLVGLSNNCTAALVEDLKNFEYQGADAILSAVPFYNKPTQEGIYQHFKAAAQVSPLPLVLYNVPGRTGRNLEADTTIRLANDFDNIIAIKEASGKIDQIRDILKRKPADFAVISGDDSLTIDVIPDGCAGIISVIGNALPKMFGDLVHFAMNGQMSQAQAIQAKLLKMYDLMFLEGSPCGVKALMEQIHLLSNVMRLPMVPVTELTYKEIQEEYKKIMGL